MSGSAPAPAGGQDQSMDDILASIRRILNEDEAEAANSAAAAEEPQAETPAAAAVAPTSPAVAPPSAPPAAALEPLELTADMLATPPREAVATPTPVATPVQEPPLSPEMDMTGLIAPAAAAAATASIGSLLRTVSNERNATVYRGGPTLEDMVRDEIRPILKEWLDANLPSMVERLVRAEIERVVNRALP